MVERWLKVFLGKKMFSSFVGLIGGAISGAVIAASTGTLDTKTLFVGAATGAAGALLGAGGRGTGTNGN